MAKKIVIDVEGWKLITTVLKTIKTDYASVELLYSVKKAVERAEEIDFPDENIKAGKK